ncbi:hypothetical protein [Azotobacter armeniacus]
MPCSAGLSLLWLLADSLLGAPREFFALRRSLVNYTGNTVSETRAPKLTNRINQTGH